MSSEIVAFIDRSVAAGSNALYVVGNPLLSLVGMAAPTDPLMVTEEGRRHYRIAALTGGVVIAVGITALVVAGLAIYKRYSGVAGSGASAQQAWNS